MTATDPIRTEVIRHALIGVTEVMGSVLHRTARSTNVRTRADFSCSLCDPGLKTVAQAFSQPMHLASMALAIPQALGEGTRTLREGESLLTNYVPKGGVHLNDIIVITPVFYEEKLAGYLANIAHHVDVGGLAAGSTGLASEVFQEGIIIPPTRIERNGEIDEDVFSLLLANVRAPRIIAGDLRAQIGANRVAAEQFRAVLQRWTPVAVSDAMEQILHATELETRKAIANLPDGTWTASGFLDDDGVSDTPVRLFVKVSINGSDIEFDTSGSDLQRPSSINSTYASTFSACAYVLKTLVLPEMPVNDGFYRVIQLKTQPGTVVHATHPAPIMGGGELHQTFVDVVIQAFAHVLPDRVIAPSKECLGQVGFGGIDPRSGDFYVFYESIGGGYGARPHADGLDGVQTHLSNTENSPIEEAESQYPFRIARYELIPDSAGLGRYRGGLGIRRDFLFPDHEVSFSILSERGTTGPPGMLGGLPARRAHFILNPDSTSATSLRSKATFRVRPGDTVSIQTAGGGGYGSPADRSEEMIDIDDRMGKVSRLSWDRVR